MESEWPGPEDPEAGSSSDHSEQTSVQTKALKPAKKNIVFNVLHTKYLVVKQVGRKKFGWKLSRKEDDDWDVLWTDGGVTPEMLGRMKPYQKINHFPGMYNISRKNYLAINLNKLRKLFPKYFQFYPRTWLVPAELSELKLRKGKRKVYIAKPEASCQGRGIFLTTKPEEFSLTDRFVLQEYVTNPLLIDGLKFDLRIYVLLAGCDPMRIYLHREGLARFATESYRVPTQGNLSKQRMHLTNYAINKNSAKFVYNEDPDADDVGHKRSLEATMLMLEEQGYDVAHLWRRIHDLVVKTLCGVQPLLAHTYKACQPFDPSNGMCFEVLGFDVLIDSRLKPWLIEVNHSPSFNTDSPLDKRVKEQVIADALTLVKVTSKARKAYHTKLKSDLIKRSMTKKHEVDREERGDDIARAQQQRDKWESAHLGGYTRIYPAEGSEKYTKYMDAARQLWQEWTGSKPARPKETTPEIKKPPVIKPEAPIRKFNTETKFKARESNRSIEPEAKAAVFERLSRPVQRTAAAIVYDSTARPDIHHRPKSHVQPCQLVVRSSRETKPVLAVNSFWPKPSTQWNKLL